MDPSGRGDITRILDEIRSGSPTALDQLFPLVYDELRRMAARYFRYEREGHTLQTTALVNEAYLRLVGGRRKEWRNRAHFFAVAARIMRRILVDHARSAKAEKRGGQFQKIDVEQAFVYAQERSEELLALDDALGRLTQWAPRSSQVVELRFFGGLTEKEIGEVLHISERTVRREWDLARAWLRRDLSQSDQGA